MYFTLSFINTVIVFIYIFGLSVFCDFAFFVTFIPLTCDDSCWLLCLYILCSAIMFERGHTTLILRFKLLFGGPSSVRLHTLL